MQTRQNRKRSRDDFEDDDRVYGHIELLKTAHGLRENGECAKRAQRNAYFEEILATLQTPGDEDVVRQREDVDFDRVVDESDVYLALADQKLHVFPFKDVRPCWHRLYTDASIAKAVKVALAGFHETESEDLAWLDEAVRLLDMAMIMTSGFGRYEMLLGIYERFDTILQEAESPSHLAKRSNSIFQLPGEECSIPQIRFPVKKFLHRPTLTSFEKHMFQLKTPALLTGILETWPALEKWQSVEFWRRITLDGRRLVPIETGRSYVDDDWGQQIIPFNEFLRSYILAEGEQKGYLAQYDLFHHLLKLNEDIATPDYCFLDTPPPDPDTPIATAKMKSDMKTQNYLSNDDEEVKKNIWFGPAWTISPLHHDPYHNILCQVVGKKYIRLYSPQHTSKLYPRATDEPAPHGEETIDMSNTSDIDIAAIETSPDEDWDEKWPGITQVPYQELVLEAGQALYIPVGWWHYVRSCSVGISVSFWWS